MIKSRTLIAIPCLNEAENIAGVLAGTIAFASSNQNSIDVLVLNDGSTDETFKIIQEQTKNIINLPFNIGISQVFQLAVRVADELNYDFLVIIDGDGQHPVAEVAKLLSVADPATYIIGARNFQTYPFSITKKIAIGIIRRLLKIRFGISLTDPTSGLRVVPKACFDQIQNLKNATNYLEDTVLIFPLLQHSTVVCREVEVKMNTRAGGKASSTGLNNILNYLSLVGKLLISKRKR
jgi:glycosyltransferase involved in cell wall biosynthesis